MLQTNDLGVWAKRCEQIKQQFPLDTPKLQDGDTKSAPITTRRAWPIAHIDHSLASIVNAIPTGMFVLRPDGTIERANTAVQDLLGFAESQFIGRNLLNFIADSFRGEYYELLEQCSQSPSLYFKHGPREALLVHVDSQFVPVDLSLSTLCKEGDEQLIVCMVHDLTSHKAEYTSLLKLAQTDHLTGLANRHTFAQQLNKMWDECFHTKQPLTLAFIDVDYFKKFNDKHGHLKGDKCLKKIADAIVQCLPTRDCIAARYGGEEFAVLLPNNALKIAQLTAIRINRAVAELKFDELGIGPEVQVTVSIGMTQNFSQSVVCAQTLLQTADDALYLAKASGRNSIITKDKYIELL